MNANNLLLRAHAAGDIMTGVAKGWDVEKSLTCKRKLVEMHRQLIWKRKKNMSNKYTDKGISAEEDAITLYCRVKKEMFAKNDIRLENEFFSGELDLFKGDEIRKAKRTIDIKTSWDWTTFPSICDTIDSDYDYQGQCYMDLSGAGLHTIAYCLVNTPANLILDEKRRLGWKMGIIDQETPEYILACIEIEKNCIVDMELFRKHYPYFEFHYEKFGVDGCAPLTWQWDIPMNERVYEMDVLRDDAKIEKIKKRWNECKIWMNKNLFKNG